MWLIIFSLTLFFISHLSASPTDITSSPINKALFDSEKKSIESATDHSEEKEDLGKKLTISTFLDKDRFPAGSNGKLAIIYKAPEGLHITDPSLGFFYVRIKENPNLIFDNPVYPEPEKYKDTMVLRGKVKVIVPFSIKKDAVPGEIKIEGEANFQLCTEGDEEICFLPNKIIFSATMTIFPENTPFSYINSSIFEEEKTKKVDEKTGKKSIEKSFEEKLNKGSIISIFLAFISGILTAFTPCVFPLIPLIIAYVGARSTESKFKGFTLSTFLVLGMALTFSFLGIIAAKSSTAFGSIGQKPGFLIAASLIFLLLSLSMFGLYEIKLPSSISEKIQQKKRKGFFGAFFMGILFGLIGAPCIGPVLVALLAWVAHKGNVIFGFLLLFFYASGIGILFILIGTFSGFIKALPKSGEWMEMIKYLFGIIMLGGAFYFARTLVSKSLFFTMIGISLVILSSFSGLFKRIEILSLKEKFLKTISILFLIFGIFYILLGLTISNKNFFESGFYKENEKDSKINWILNDEEKAFYTARLEGKPVLIDFYAEWCLACKELEVKTFSNPEVVNQLKKFVMLKFDLTKENEWTRDITKKYNVFGMPTILIFDKEGKEVQRISGFIPPERIIHILNSF
ncbi:MAG: protein-disulfide reductase DsbD [Acidobacteriota bacterium]